MEFLESNLLSFILFLPVVVAAVVALLPNSEKTLIRWVAFIGSLLTFVLALILWANFESNRPGFQFEELNTWYSAIHSSYHIGVDGISLSMVLLTTLLTPLVILASFKIEDRVKAYMALFLLLETGMLGVFVSLDLLLFFVFWEIGLVPMYFLINQWGSEKGERELWGGRKVSARGYASFKFMIFTMGGSLGLLLAIQMIGVISGTFDLPLLVERWNSIDKPLMGIPVS